MGAQIGPLGVFCGYQVLELFDWITGRRWKARLILLASLAAAGAATVHWLLMHGVADGVVWDAHVRIKSLFIPHTKTGNPLTDSVAEHQSTPSSVYVQYLHHTLYLAPIGVVFLLLSILFGLFQKRGPVRPEGKLFVIAYLICSGYFASKMIRLVLLAAPAASIAAGASLGLPLDLGLAMVFESAWVGRTKFAMKRLVGLLILALLFSAHMVKYPMHKKPLATFKIPAPVDVEIEIPYPKLYQKKKGSKEWTLNMPKLLKKGRGDDFFDHCVQLAEALSEPQIMTRGRHQDGSTVIIDDWREGYWWLKNNTPPDARIMAWWDYGYQITGAYLYIGTYMCACTHPARARTHIDTRLPVPRCAPLRLRAAERDSAAVGRPTDRPIRRHRQPHVHRGRQHVEPRAHRTARPRARLVGEERPRNRTAPRRLRARVDHTVRLSAAAREPALRCCDAASVCSSHGCALLLLRIQWTGVQLSPVQHATEYNRCAREWTGTRGCMEMTSPKARTWPASLAPCTTTLTPPSSTSTRA